MVVANDDTKKEKNKVTSNLLAGLFRRKVKKGIVRVHKVNDK